MKKLFSFFFVLSFFLFHTESQEKIVPEWQSVLGGNVVTSPKKTSYGFIMLSEGRIMNAITENGDILWRRNIKGIPSKHFSVTSDNFVYITTDNSSKLSLYNPDGTFLWEVALETPAILDPVPGRDGRVFIVQENAISCYGTLGVRKWHIEVPKSAGLPLAEMNDGSLLYILDSTKNGASFALRISPYGEKIEEIEFIDTVSTLKSYNDGVILGFDNGAIGSCAVVEGVTETTGFASNVQHGASPKDIVIGNDAFAVLFSNASVSEYSLKDQSLFWTQRLSSALLQEYAYSTYIYDSYFFASTQHVEAYSSAHTGNGGVKILEKTIQNATKALYPVVTNSAYVILSYSNWVIAGFNLLSDVQVDINIAPSSDNNSMQSYEGFQSKTRLQNVNLDTISKTLIMGEYGDMELEYKRIVDNAIHEYQFEYMSFQKNYNAARKAQIYAVSSLFQSSDYNFIVPLIITNETDEYFLELAFKIAANIAYDPDELMLKTIQNYFDANKTRVLDNALVSMCDAVYAICRYMGKPSLTKVGKEILSDILRIHSSGGEVQKKAQDVLRMFIENEL